MQIANETPGKKFLTCILPGARLFCPGVRLVVNLFQSLAGNVSIYLGCAEISMSEHLLNAPEIRTGIEQMGRE